MRAQQPSPSIAYLLGVHHQVELICRRCAHITIRDPLHFLGHGGGELTLAQIAKRARCTKCDSRDVGAYEVLPT